jgi:hypothetical protein
MQPLSAGPSADANIGTSAIRLTRLRFPRRFAAASVSWQHGLPRGAMVGPARGAGHHR